MTATTEPKKTIKEIAIEQVRAEMGTNFRMTNTSRKTLRRLRHSLTTSAIRNRIAELETPVEVRLRRAMGKTTIISSPQVAVESNPPTWTPPRTVRTPQQRRQTRSFKKLKR